MSVFIRPYRDSDYEQFRWLRTRTPPAGRVQRQPEPWHEELDRVDEVFIGVWVAVEDDGELASVVGSACLELVGAVPVGPPVPDFIDIVGATGRLHEMRVAPERQRRGIGTLLMDAVIEWASAQGHAGMILETTPQQEAAVEFYRAAGFVERGRSMIGEYELVWFEMRPLRGV
jgi:GNAT superfamily N-acetyltransferase